MKYFTFISLESVIRTNTTNTVLTVDAKQDSVTHYGYAGIVNIKSVNSSSYHENGTVPFLEVTGGHVILEKEARVEIFHFAVEENSNIFENKDGKKISLDVSALPEQNMPRFSRDAVEIDDNGTYVAEVKDQKTEYIWLFGSGIKEQMVVVETTEAIAEYGELKTNINPGAEEGSVAEQIANPAKRNDEGQLVNNSNEVIDVTNANWKDKDVLDNLTEVVKEELESKEDLKDEVAAEAVNSEVIANNPNEDYAFRIGTKGYNTLSAVNTDITKSCTVFMLKDYTQSGGIEFLQGKTNLEIVVDLGGHTLSPTSWIDIHNSYGTTTFRNGNIDRDALIYLESANAHLIFNNISMDRTDGFQNKFFCFTKGFGQVELINCVITGDDPGDEYLFGNFKGGEKISIENTIINWRNNDLIEYNNSYDANKLSYIEFKGTSAINYSDSNIVFTASYDVETINGGVRYTLVPDRETWLLHRADAFENQESKTIFISTPEELGLLAYNVNAGYTYEGFTFELTSNIDLSAYDWVPIGYFADTSRPFKGTFDGFNYTISGLKNTTQLDNRGVGLFGKTYAPAVIKNLNVEGTIISNKMYTGGIVGHGYATISNCTFTGNVRGNMQTGGICGSGGFTITNCTFAGNVNGGCWVGGITGNCQDGGAYTNCIVNGNVTALYVGDINGGKGTGTGYAGGGGIAGLVCYRTQVFENCTFNGILTEAGMVVESRITGGYLED